MKHAVVSAFSDNVHSDTPSDFLASVNGDNNDHL